MTLEEAFEACAKICEAMRGETRDQSQLTALYVAAKRIREASVLAQQNHV